ncbi:MAG TPA: DUF4388 domain-containing protein [Acidimicrobiia bacterium]|nr:DUF4388 domain-containing protein [Acidimicrobiia bacterium]
MSLSGNLGFVSIDEVLRLLTRSKQQGAVNINGNGLRGRVFVGKSGIDLATTSDNSDLHRHLVNSGYADEKTLDRITSGETTLAAIADTNQALIDLLREMSVESLYQIADRGGDFEVHEGLTTPYASPKSFDLEALLEDAQERRRQWAEVREVIADLTGPIAFRRDLGEREEVTLKVDDWKVLSEIGSGASVHEIADRLGTTEFWTARATARLVSSELVQVAIDETVEEVPEYEAGGNEHLEEPEVDLDAQAQGAEQAVPENPGYVDSPAQHTVVEDDEHVDPDESWWKEPEDQTAESEDLESKTPEVVSEELSKIPPVGESDEEDADPEGDTEAFLEKVFSELDSSESEAEEGHGLLRRRRMGTLRDFSSDS